MAIELVIIGIAVLFLFGIFLIFLALRWETLATNKPLRWFAGAFGLLALAMFVVIVGIFLPEVIFILVAIGIGMLAYVALHTTEKRKGKPKRIVFPDGEEGQIVED